MNYFNSLSFREKVRQLGTCRFMDAGEFNGTDALAGKKIVILGCGAQGLHQGLNLRDSGLDVSFALRDAAIAEKRPSWKGATENGFIADSFEKLIPGADLVMNLTPDKQHSSVVEKILPLMKKNAALGYSHGFNIVEEGMKIRDDITVIMIAPKSPGSEVREEYKRGFGVPTLIAVHPENDPEHKGWDMAKAYAAGLGSDRAGVLASSFVAEVKSDLMGEQTILCGMLQTGSLLCHDFMLANGVERSRAAALVQYGWESITEALKQGGITHMMDRLSNAAKIRAYNLSVELKTLMTGLYRKHMDNILSGQFSQTMMEDWNNGDKDLLAWREETRQSAFEQSPETGKLPYQTFFDEATVMVAMVKAGVELAFEVMVEAGIKEESAYYESLHELPLIANLISRKRLYEMNRIISDTAEYGNYLFAKECMPLLKDVMAALNENDLGRPLVGGDVADSELIKVNDAIRNHPIESVGALLRAQMRGMKALAV